ncbi:MAG TPA: amidase [Ramlibacter sp.]|jgi:Asp-tRNA(Asn)/Glu-tRNA(Gln) amidotransferase A subunit family amidase|uniref:amidase n=1 Tax=Ramlibacter sp. TaxID=1917967 RepID=UPI002D58C198|nr:amidase [Ramlibacter sp.]HZY19604.1 amidase [Ramlibacter sp.]
MSAAARDALVGALDAIAAGDAELKAFVALHGHEHAGRELERALAHGGALRGLPIGVKDIFDTAALPTSYGSPLYAGHRPRADAAIVQAIRRAGGVVVGKTSTTEFAYLNPTPTRNPRAPGRTPGGSSAGSAAAVAAGLLPLAVGTQTGGSVIRPASYCGVVGFKPTYGALPTPGLKPFSWSLDTVGLFTANVTHMAAYGAAISGQGWHAAAAGARMPVFGIAWTYPWEALSPSARRVLETARRQLQAAGATVRDVDLPAWIDPVFRAHDAVQGWEAARALADEHAFHADQLSPVLRAYLADARQVTDAAYEAGLAQAAMARSQLAQLFEGIDVLLTPAAPDEPPAGFGSTGASSFNRAWTLLHVPCLTVPGATGVNGLPMGVQVIAPIRAEALCLRAGAVLEGALAA